VIPVLEGVLNTARPTTAFNQYRRHNIKETLNALHRQPAYALAPDAAAWARELAELGDDGATAESCLAAVYAEPYEDAPRLVYADWLLERDDARGELITLQCARNKSREDRRREKELLALHAHRWLGPLAPVILPTGLIYERGFVAARLSSVPRHPEIPSSDARRIFQSCYIPKPSGFVRAGATDGSRNFSHACRWGPKRRVRSAGEH
jgi:uncharacterized protein (TIGR02996 family)